MNSPSNAIKSLTLENYRCFPKLYIDFEPDLTVIIADNGAGKSTVLDALAVSLSAFVGAFHNGRRVGIARGDVFLKIIDNKILEMEPQYPSVLHCCAEINNMEVCWERRMNTPTSSNTFKEAHSVIQIGDGLQKAIKNEEENADIILPVIAYYGTGRLWREKKQTKMKAGRVKSYSRTAGYLDCLDPDSSYRFFVSWLRDTTEAHNEIKSNNIQKYGDVGFTIETPYQVLLKGLTETVNLCMAHTGWKNLRYSSIYKSPIIEHAEYGVLEVSQLSDGLRNMIALVADIAYRALTLNKQLKDKAPQLSSGIVLIDEIDMHLHPQWQQTILNQLKKAFPKIQFIVTTHSPQVLTAINSIKIRNITKNSEGNSIAAVPVAESYARSNSDVLQAVMHINPIPQFAESKDLAKYRNIIEQGDVNDPSLATIFENLKLSLGENHPELVRLEMIKRRRSMLG